MRRSWNPRVWLGFALVLAGIASYPFFFIQFPVTRDFPWASLLVLGLAGFLLFTGVRRAFRQPQKYRGKVSGPILATLGTLLTAYFLVAVFYTSRGVPASLGAPAVGAVAPDFTLPDSTGGSVTLSTLLNSPFSTNEWPPKGDAREKTAGAILIFYRGYW